MTNIDLIVYTEHMYTLEGDGLGYRNGYALAIDRGKILAVAPRKEIEGAYKAETVIDNPRLLALPGFIDAHMHTGHGVYRGVAQDIGNWMMDGISPFSQSSTPEAHVAGSKLAIAEAILNGTTTIGDDGRRMEGALNFIDQVGVRGNVSIRIRNAIERIYKPGELYEFSEAMAEETLDEFTAMHDKFDGRDGGRIRIRIGPQGADFVCPDTLEKVYKLAKDRNTKMHIHLSQGSRETKQMVGRYGERTIAYMSKKGYLDSNLIGIHLTDATPEEAAFVASTGASMVLCSASIGIIDGIVPPARFFKQAGGNVGLGSDQAPGNNCHNIFNEMRLTAMFNKIMTEDPETMPAWMVLRMATIEGAKALGIDQVTGSLEAGKAADLILVDLDEPALMPTITTPMRTFVPNLVYAAKGSEVDTVVAAGNILVRDRKPVTFDLPAIRAEVQAHVDEIGAKAADIFWEINGKNAQFMKEDKL